MYIFIAICWMVIIVIDILYIYFNLELPKIISILAIILVISYNIMFSLSAYHSDMALKKTCDKESISYTLVETSAEMLHMDKYDVYVIFKHCSQNDIEPVDAIMICGGGNITEHDAEAILTAADIKDLNELEHIEHTYE